MRRIRDELHGLNAELKSGSISAEDWAARFDELLYEGHRVSIEMGWARAGAAALEESELDQLAREAKDTESTFLQGFIGHVEDRDSRYWDDDGELNIGLLDWRAGLYVGKMRGTANDAFLEGSADDDEFEWVLGSTEEHCEDCPRIAADSPYTKDTLYTTPGGGDTECLGNCDCEIKRADGVKGFPRVHLDDDEVDGE